MRKRDRGAENEARRKRLLDPAQREHDNEVERLRRSTPDVRQQMNADARLRYWQNPEKERERFKKYCESNPETARGSSRAVKDRYLVERWDYLLVKSSKHKERTARFGPSDLDEAYLRELFAQQNGRCYWLGIPMVPSAVKRDPRRPSVDRLDNSKGYVRGNVVLTTMFANMGRSQLDAESFRAFVEELRISLPR